MRAGGQVDACGQKEVNEIYESLLSEEKDNLNFLKQYDPNEYICIVKNNYGGYDYE